MTHGYDDFGNAACYEVTVTALAGGGFPMLDGTTPDEIDTDVMVELAKANLAGLITRSISPEVGADYLNSEATSPLFDAVDWHIADPGARLVMGRMDGCPAAVMAGMRAGDARNDYDDTVKAMRTALKGRARLFLAGIIAKP